MAAFVASQARSTTSSSFEADLDDSDDSDDGDDSDDEPKIRPVYRTQSGRGIRMRAADRAYAPAARPPCPSCDCARASRDSGSRQPLCARLQRGPAEARRLDSQRYCEGPAACTTSSCAQDSSGGASCASHSVALCAAARGSRRVQL